MTMSKDIITKMVMEDIHYKTLSHLVRKFMPVTEEQIRNVVRGTYENKNIYILSAYVLGLNQYVPKDFDPTKLNIPKPKRKPKVKKSIPLYKQNFQERIENKAIINKITDGVGSVLKVSEILNCTYSTVLSWKRVRKDDCVYIPPKYIIPVIKLCVEYDIGVDEYDLTSMLPTQKKKLFSDIKYNQSVE